MLKAKHTNYKFECGLDEAGRGCLAGPVTAAAVILKPNFKHELIDDSKKLTKIKREELSKIIIENSIDYSIGFVYPRKIDEINILNASILAMHKCIKNLNVKPEFLIIDGNRFKKYKDIPHETVIKGDGKYLSIASASILAKYSRDIYMEKISKKFPDYFWHKNKGYPTKEHKNAIIRFGITNHHRKSFKLYDEQLTIDF
jgi:ribonuclease HII